MIVVASKAVAGLCILCTALAAALAMPTGAMAINGTTASTCKAKKAEGGTGFSEAHCRAATGSGAKYEHAAIEEGTSTEVTLSNGGTSIETTEPTIGLIKSFTGSAQIRFVVTGIHAEGWAENSVAGSGEHQFNAKGVTFSYTGVAMAEPVGSGCTVYKNEGGEKGEAGAFDSRPLAVTTAEQGDALKFAPEDGNVFATMILDGCAGAFKSWNGPYTFTGSIASATNGATVNFVHTSGTLQGTLSLSGFNSKVGFETSLTISGRGHEANFTPLSVTPIDGTTAFTCKEKDVEGGEGFDRGHCKAEDATGSDAQFEHQTIEEGSRTVISATNGGTGPVTEDASVLKLTSTIAGIPVELQATGVEGMGWTENALDPSGEHYIHGRGTLSFTGVTLTKPEKGKGCLFIPDNNGAKSPKETINTKLLTASTTGEEGAVRFTPENGDVLASFYITNCPGELKALNGTHEINGSVAGSPDGATINFQQEETTAEETLVLDGALPAGLEGSLTVAGSQPDPSFSPLGFTTAETP